MKSLRFPSRFQNLEKTLRIRGESVSIPDLQRLTNLQLNPAAQGLKEWAEEVVKRALERLHPTELQKTDVLAKPGEITRIDCTVNTIVTLPPPDESNAGSIACVAPSKGSLSYTLRCPQHTIDKRPERACYGPVMVTSDGTDGWYSTVAETQLPTVIPDVTAYTIPRPGRYVCHSLSADCVVTLPDPNDWPGASMEVLCWHGTYGLIFSPFIYQVPFAWTELRRTNGNMHSVILRSMTLGISSPDNCYWTIIGSHSI